MDYQITPLNRLHLWTLLAHGGSRFDALLRPKMDKRNRDGLISLGLVEALGELPTAEERKRIRNLSGGKKAESAKALEGKAPAARAKAAPLLKIRLTGQGAAWLRDNGQGPISAQAKIPARLVEFLLEALASPAAQGVLAALASQAGAEPKPGGVSKPGRPGPGSPVRREDSPEPLRAAEAVLDPAQLLRRIREFDPNKLMASGGLRLSELRKAFPELGRDEVDRALIELQKRGDLVIYRFDDPSKITEADREAALMTAGGPRHYLFFP